MSLSSVLSRHFLISVSVHVCALLKPLSLSMSLSHPQAGLCAIIRGLTVHIYYEECLAQGTGIIPICTPLGCLKMYP